MIIYNITVKVDAVIASEWLQWLKEEQAPQILATGFFSRFQVLQLLQVDDSEGPTYAVQFVAASVEDYETYMTHYAERYREMAAERWGSNFVAFNTLMQVVA